MCDGSVNKYFRGREAHASLPLSVCLSLSHTHTLSVCLSVCLSLSLSHTHTLSLSQIMCDGSVNKYFKSGEHVFDFLVCGCLICATVLYMRLSYTCDCLIYATVLCVRLSYVCDCLMCADHVRRVRQQVLHSLPLSLSHTHTLYQIMCDGSVNKYLKSGEHVFDFLVAAPTTTALVAELVRNPHPRTLNPEP